MATPIQSLKSKWFLTLIGVILLCLLIWFAGPYMPYEGVNLLVPASGRLVAILIVFVVWALVWQWKSWRESRAARALVAAGEPVVEKSPGRKPIPAGAGVGGADAQLATRFQEAFTALRKSKEIEGNLLDLPWYIIIGPPGSGKTTALASSGLEFPLADRFGKVAMRGVGGTRSCDWWFTTKAILLDTAGRYTTQDSDERVDSAGWVEFLTLLKKHRRRRPINGVLLAFSLIDIASFTHADREKHALAIRRRLQELHQYLGVQLPVYLLLTKADLIAGFDEYFDDLDQRGRAQVWGATFPWDDSRHGRAHEHLESEFNQLVARLAARVPDRLQSERDAGRRRAIFAFPQQIASLKGGVTDFVREIFASSSFHDRVWLRGVYLTSGTQNGTPIDRMMGALASTFGLGVQAAAVAPGQGKAFFIGKLLANVVFGEAGLAGSDRKAEMRSAAASAALYFAIVVGVIALVAGMLVSYRANSAYLADVASTARPLEGVASAAKGATLAQSVPSLDALQLVVDSASQYHDHVPWRMRFGLYQGTSLTRTAEEAYFRQLNLSLGPAASTQFARRIRESAREPDKLYEYLKAYLMLGDPNKLNPAQMKVISNSEWPQALAEDPASAERVAAHFDALTAVRDRVHPVPVDTDLVEQARVSLQQASSLPLLMYSRVRLSYAGDEQRSLRLDRELGLGAQSVMVRKSGAALTVPFPALYTRAVFDEFNSRGKVLLVKQFLEDAWILGDSLPANLQSPRLAADVVQLYEQDYINNWDTLLTDLTVRAPRDSADAVAVLGALSSAGSPLKRLLVLTEANTNLLKPLPASDLAVAPEAKAGQMAGQFGAALTGTAGPKPGSMVTQHFGDLHALVAGPAGGAPIDRLLMQMGKAQQQLQSASGLGGQPGSPAVLAAIQNGLAALQYEAAQMPPMVGDLISGLSGQSRSAAMGVARTDLFNRYQTQVVGQCLELVGTRYPFNRSSQSDVTLEDFAHVFASGGLYDSFYQANLAGLVDNSLPVWRWRDGAEAVGGSNAMLAQFQAAERIRQVFFKPGGQTPEFHFNVSPEDLDNAIDRFRLEIDGQVFEYRHGPPRTISMAWPGGQVGRAIASFELLDGGHPQATFQGPWALFRLLDQAALQPQSETRFVGTFGSNGRQARVVIEALSIRNPLARQELARFRCK